MTEPIFDVLETALRLHIRLDQTYRLLRGGALIGAEKVDGVWRVPLSAIEMRIARIAARRRSTSNTRARELPLTA